MIDPALNGILPWTRSCLVCGEQNERGLRLRSRVGNGVVALDYRPVPSDLGWRHAVHGGLTITLMDEVMTWAAILASRRPCVAAEISSRLKRPIAVGQALRVEGRLARDGRVLRTAGVVLDAQDGRELAAATGKYVPMTDDQFQFCEGDFVVTPESLSLKELFG
jgi:acyl-CoA hydrolase